MNNFKTKGTTIIFVSHSMETVQNFCERVIIFENGKIIADAEPEKAINIYQKKINS